MDVASPSDAARGTVRPCLVCGAELDPQSPNSIALVVERATGEREWRFAHVAHLPPMGTVVGAGEALTVLGPVA
jgi:hypothetical protein